MIMLARAAGIPARMAVGYLRGEADGDERVVRVSDAHAWPELSFPQLGWVRFEPTPGGRSGVAPEYSPRAHRVGRLLGAGAQLVVVVLRPPVGRSVARRHRPGRRPERRRRAASTSCGSPPRTR